MKTVLIVLAVALLFLGIARVGGTDATLEQLTTSERTSPLEVMTPNNHNPQRTIDGKELQ